MFSEYIVIFAGFIILGHPVLLSASYSKTIFHVREVYTCRSDLKKMRKEVESFIDMFNALATSEEKVLGINECHRKSEISTTH